jgi:hypothetical protein
LNRESAASRAGAGVRLPDGPTEVAAGLTVHGLSAKPGRHSQTTGPLPGAVDAAGARELAGVPGVAAVGGDPDGPVHAVAATTAASSTATRAARLRAGIRTA